MKPSLCLLLSASVLPLLCGCADEGIPRHDGPLTFSNESYIPVVVSHSAKKATPEGAPVAPAQPGDMDKALVQLLADVNRKPVSPPSPVSHKDVRTGGVTGNPTLPKPSGAPVKAVPTQTEAAGLDIKKAPKPEVEAMPLKAPEKTSQEKQAQKSQAPAVKPAPDKAPPADGHGKPQAPAQSSTQATPVKKPSPSPSPAGASKAQGSH